METVERLVARVESGLVLDDVEAEEAIRSAIQTLTEDHQLDCQAEFSHYGSGYASFVDAWFFQRESAFRIPDQREHYVGLAVLFCRFARVYCLMEGERSWSGGSSASYLPGFEEIDRFASRSVNDLVPIIESTLTRLGWRRLVREELETEFHSGTTLPANLIDGHPRYFDALFHWED